MLSERQKTLSNRFHVTRKKPYHMDEILSYVESNGKRFRKGGSSLLSLLKEEIQNEESISLEKEIYDFLKGRDNFYTSYRSKKVFNKKIYRSKGVIVFP